MLQYLIFLAIIMMAVVLVQWNIIHSENNNFPENIIVEKIQKQNIRTESLGGLTVVKSLHSGFYRPNNWYSIESYSGAWLVSSERFFSKYAEVEKSSSLEGISFAVNNEMNEKHQLYEWNMMTRDFFDFHVVHLSSTSNLAIKYDPARPETLLPMKLLTERISQFATEMESAAVAKIMQESYHDDLYDNTLAIIPFSVISASKSFANVTTQQNIRIEYFKATYWSIRRYIKHICVSVGTETDWRELVKIQANLKAPIYQMIDLSNINDPNRQLAEPGRHNLDLPKRTLQYIINNEEPMLYRQFKYIYYTEADQVLYLRSSLELTKAIDVDPVKHSLIPHRMHTAILPSVYPEIKNVEGEKPGQKSRFLDGLRNVNVITLGTEGSDGSCCDDGRFVFDSCHGNFWYRCSEQGLRNYTQWIMYGRNGFPMPTGSTHQARCRYSHSRRLCPLPKTDCDESKRFPVATNNPARRVCKELDKIKTRKGLFSV